MASRSGSSEAGALTTVRSGVGSSARMDPSDRPAASGHRFGPDLACSECGVSWDLHQREPSPCRSEAGRVAEADVFARRPEAPPESGSPVAESGAESVD